jgi:hypothetical protein
MNSQKNADEDDEEEEEEKEDEYGGGAWIPDQLRRMVEHDLNELHWMIPHLPVDIVLRIHSLRFYFNCLTDQPEEVNLPPIICLKERVS